MNGSPGAGFASETLLAMPRSGSTTVTDAEAGAVVSSKSASALVGSAPSVRSHRPRAWLVSTVPAELASTSSTTAEYTMVSCLV